MTEFLSCLYIDFDFEAAQTKLQECESVYFNYNESKLFIHCQVLSNDLFLTHCLDEFRESARLLIFEMFCRIHQCISIDMLARRLNMQKVSRNLQKNLKFIGGGRTLDSQSDSQLSNRGRQNRLPIGPSSDEW